MYEIQRFRIHFSSTSADVRMHASAELLKMCILMGISFCIEFPFWKMYRIVKIISCEDFKTQNCYLETKYVFISKTMKIQNTQLSTKSCKTWKIQTHIRGVFVRIRLNWNMALSNYSNSNTLILFFSGSGNLFQNLAHNGQVNTPKVSQDGFTLVQNLIISSKIDGI